MGIKKVLKKMMKKELKKHDKKMAKGNKLIKAFMKEFMEYKAKSIGYLEPIFMANVDYPVDDFSAIAYVDASFSDYDRFGSIGIVMLTRTEVIQYSEIPKDLYPSALTSTNHELIAAAKAIEMAKEKHIKRLISELLGNKLPSFLHHPLLLNCSPKVNSQVLHNVNRR